MKIEELDPNMTDKPEVEISEGVDYLANHTAGGQIRFRSDCRKLVLKADLGISEFMPHMAPTGSSGFDLYAGPPGEERFVAVAPPPLSEAQYTRRLFPFSDPAERKMRSFIINFPLLNPTL